MPRAKTYSRESIATETLPHFWECGFHGLSVDELVKLTGISRHALYAEIGGKDALYLSVFEVYDRIIVSPAFSVVEDNKDLDSIETYFMHQIKLAEEKGLPGPGCLIGNAAIERAPHNREVARLVTKHNDRLRRGFSTALANAASGRLRAKDRDDLADYLVVSAQGLWSVSRTVKEGKPLRNFVRIMMSLVSGRIEQC